MAREAFRGSPEIFLKEPYRRQLLIIRYRLQLRLEALKRRGTRTPPRPPHAYQSEYQFLDHLRLIDQSLRHHNDVTVADGELKDLIRLVETFGFHLARLDLRDESGKFSQAVADVIKLCGLEDNYNNAEAKRKTELLTSLLDAPLQKIERHRLPRQTRRVLETFACIREAIDGIGEKAVGNYVISMTHNANHVLEMTLLGKIEGLIGADEDGKR